MSSSPYRSTVIKLYKTLMFMGRDYPLGYEYFRTRCHDEFLKNSKETDHARIRDMIRRGNYMVKELEALYKLRKYRTLKRRYYDDPEDEYNKALKRINDEFSP